MQDATDTEISEILGSGDSVMDMLSGLRENVDTDAPAAADNNDEWPSEPTDVVVSSGDLAETKTPDQSEAEAPKAGADKAPEEIEQPPETDDADSQDDAPDQKEPSDTEDDVETEPDEVDKEEPEPVPPVDLEKVEAEYRASDGRIREMLENKYSSEGEKLYRARQNADVVYRQNADALKARADAIYASAVEIDPVTEHKTERPLLPSEYRQLQEIHEKATEARDAYNNAIRGIESESNRVLDAYRRDEAVAKLDSWTNYIIGVDPRLASMKDVVRSMAMAGEIRPNADGKIDSEELYLRAQYRAKATGTKASQPRAASTADVTTAQAKQAEAREKQAVKERGLGTIAAGKGGSGKASTKAGKDTEPDYMKGASAECVAGLQKLDAYLNGEF